jgi:hypothetical protein
MQQNSSEGRTIKAANAAKASTYTPSLISLKGSYVAMIFAGRFAEIRWMCGKNKGARTVLVLHRPSKTTTAEMIQSFRCL